MNREQAMTLSEVTRVNNLVKMGDVWIPVKHRVLYPCAYKFCALRTEGGRVAFATRLEQQRHHETYHTRSDRLVADDLFFD